MINSLDFSPNDRLLVSASGDQTVRIWNIRDGATIKILTKVHSIYLGGYNSAVFSPDGRYVAASHPDGMVAICGVRTGQLMRNVRVDEIDVSDVVIILDGRSFVSGNEELKYWDISSLYTNNRDSQTEAEGEVQLVREFLGHEVRCFNSPFFDFASSCVHSAGSCLLPFRLPRWQMACFWIER
jgi:WD40 repeat protein